MTTALCATSTVLVVETQSVRDLIGTVLEKEHYTVLRENTTGAIDILRRREHPVDLLITNEPWRFEPYPHGLRVLYISGAPDREFLLERRGETFGYLQKPFRFHELLRGVRELLPAAVEPA